MKNSTCFCRRLFMFALLLSIGSKCFSQLAAKSLIAKNGTHIGFYEYKPADYSSNPSAKYPLIIFLHGMGERGNGTTELAKLKGVAIPKFINGGHKMRFFWNGKWETFLVLAPQLSTAYTKWPSFYIDEVIKYAENNLNIDKDRVYLTGMSMGGGGVWNYASMSPENAKKFAAIAPVCGICAMNNAYNISSANLPVWASHARNDPRVPIRCTLNAVESINATKPNVAPILTIYEDGGHTIWDRSMDTGYAWHEPNLYEWFLGQKRNLPPNRLPVANAGDNKETTPGAGYINLDGSGSYDSDGNIVKFIWKQIAGPVAARISSRLLPTTSAGGLSMMGTYKFELTVVDNRTGWQKDTVTIKVLGGPPFNIRPNANAGIDQSILLPTNSAILDGTQSFDEDGSITSYYWSKISGPAGGTPLTSKTSKTKIDELQEGVYKYMLEVIDNKGAVDRDTIIVTVNPQPGPANLPPTAYAGRDITITLPQTSAVLNGNKSFDDDGTIVSYSWLKINGPSGGLISSALSAKTSITDLKEGVYTYSLTVKDDKNTSARDTIMVIVKVAIEPVNQAPTAIAGKDRNITLPLNFVELDGEESFDVDGSVISYTWSKIGGPSGGTILSPESPKTKIDNLVEGRYRYALEIKDNKGAVDGDTIAIMVRPAPEPVNEKPTAYAGKDIVIMLPDNSVVLDGNASSDIDGMIRSYLWSKISGPAGANLETPETAVTQLTFLNAGTYRFQLKVTDNKGATDLDTVNIRVKPIPVPGNVEPVAQAGVDITLQLPLSKMQLDGSASKDPDGAITEYLWTQLSGPENALLTTPNEVISEVTNLTEGTYTYLLEVTDNRSAKSFDTILVNVLAAPPPPNEKPIANAGKDLTITLPLNSALLDGSTSFDPDGVIEKFSWTKLSGPAVALILNAGTETPTLVGLTKGEYIFRLTVSDNNGATGFDDIKISVIATTNSIPQANAGNDTTLILPANSAVLNGSASTDDGAIIQYEWTDISKAMTSSISNRNNAVTEVSALSVGDHLFELTVTDNFGIKSRDTVRITVLKNEIGSNQKMSLSPNPARDMIRINFSSEYIGPIKINIYDGKGGLIKAYHRVKSGLDYAEVLDIHEFRPGFYVIELFSEKEKRLVQRFIKL